MWAGAVADVVIEPVARMYCVFAVDTGFTVPAVESTDVADATDLLAFMKYLKKVKNTPHDRAFLLLLHDNACSG
jgi:hypothetical protein